MSSFEECEADPATAAAISAARARMDALSRTAELISPVDAEARTLLRVSSQHGAADLSIVDRNYALVASGVGWVDASLPPGTYSARQQVGDEVEVTSITVVPGGGKQTLELPSLNFASPIPMPGTRYVKSDATASDLRELCQVPGGFRLLLWSPAEGAVQNNSPAVRERISFELDRLRLERFDISGPAARRPIGWVGPHWTDRGNALVCADLEPGCYVLVQTHDSGRQQCIPIWVQPKLVTCVFLLSFEKEGSRVPVQLDHAGMAFMPLVEECGALFQASLYQLEAARKALTQGRQVQGWAGRTPEGQAYARVNPLLHLLDATLVFSSGSTSKEVPLAYGYDAAKGLGEDFPDSLALRTIMRRVGEAEVPDAVLDLGPPLLRRSWDVLLRGSNSNAAMGRVMGYPFTADGSGAWFVWSEEEARGVSAAMKVDAVRDAVRSRPPSFGDAQVALPPPPPRSSIGLSALLASGVKFVAALLVDKYAQQKQLPPPTEQPVSYDIVVKLIVALADSGILEKYLESGQKYAAARGVPINDEVLQRLVQSLDVLTNKTLVKALTAEVLVREALVSLGLPKDKVIRLVRAALTDLMDGLDFRDKAVALKAMSAVMDTAERWLDGKPPTLY